MTAAQPQPAVPGFTAPVDQPAVAGDGSLLALRWLVRLRWLAVAGQLLAVVGAWAFISDVLPLPATLTVVAATLVTNLALAGLMRRGVPLPAALLPAIILLDVLLLTALLALTGGTENPFAPLYLVHVSLAVVVLGVRWAWGMLTVSVALLWALSNWHLPLVDGGLDDAISRAGQLVAILIIGGLIVYFTGRVIAASRQRDAELAALRERAVRSESLAALTTLAAGAAHELGTPLGTIAVVAKELQQPGGSVEGRAEDAALIRREVDRCRMILDRMRGDIAETAVLASRRATVADVLAAVETDAKGPVIVQAVGTIPDVKVQPRALEQALVLLVNNAHDASPDDEHGGPDVLLKVVVEGRRVSFAVIDRGSGMDADTLRQAENPFFTTKAPGKGMGLGLFLVRLTADRNDGTFVIDSTPGQGTTAILTLPVADGGRAHQAAAGHAPRLTG